MHFSLSAHQCKIAHINLREEKHGDEPVRAVDIKVECDVPNDFLSYLSPTLKQSLYAKAENQADMLDEPNYLPRLLYPDLGTLGWAGSMTSKVTLHSTTRARDTELHARVDKIKFTCRDGGTVGLSFRVATLPEEHVLGKIVGLLGLEIKVSVEEAEVADEVRGGVRHRVPGGDGDGEPE